MTAYRQVYDSHHQQADCQKTRISSGTLHSVIKYGLRFTFYIRVVYVSILCRPTKHKRVLCWLCSHSMLQVLCNGTVSVCLSVPSTRWVCCSGSGRQEISIISGGCWVLQQHGTQQTGVQQQMRAVSRRQLMYEAEYKSFCVCADRLTAWMISWWMSFPLTIEAKSVSCVMWFHASCLAISFSLFFSGVHMSYGDCLEAKMEDNLYCVVYNSCAWWYAHKCEHAVCCLVLKYKQKKLIGCFLWTTV